MNSGEKVIITGAAGFIGSALARFLAPHFPSLILVDRFGIPEKQFNESQLPLAHKIDRDEFVEWLAEHAESVHLLIHLGARTDTTEMNFRVLDSLNLSYSKQLWEICTAHQIPMIYASSAATYGNGTMGFSDQLIEVDDLKPLNPYGVSKQLFDCYALSAEKTPPYWIGLKFFNVFGPGEQHKNRMASVVFHAWKQIRATGKIQLFKSHVPEYRDGEQLRDFIYLDDLLKLIQFFIQNRVKSGLYNAGTGIASSFIELVTPVFETLNLNPDIRFTDIPEDIRNKYQYYTCADTAKLRAAGFSLPFTPLRDAVAAYTQWLEAHAGEIV